MSTHCFTNKSEYDSAVEEFHKTHDWSFMEANNLENSEIGTIFYNIENRSEFELFTFKILDEQPEIINFDNYDDWHSTLTKVKAKYNKSLLSCDSAKELRIGFLSLDTKKIYRIALSNVKEHYKELGSIEARQALGSV